MTEKTGNGDKNKAKQTANFTACWNVNKHIVCAFCNDAVLVRTYAAAYDSGWRVILNIHNHRMAACPKCVALMAPEYYRLLA